MKNGLDLALAGAPEQAIHRGPPIHRVALCGTDFPGLKARICVEAGQRVNAGDPLFTDRDDPAVAVTAPGAGTIVAVHRGPRRALGDIVVRLDGEASASVDFVAGPHRPLEGLDRREVVQRLCRSGLWTALRTRPFGHVPESSAVPSAIFVTAIDTHPLAADPVVVIQPRLAAFEAGLRALARLTEGPLWLCTGPQWSLGTPRIVNLRHAQFSGAHPAGLPGTHIHWLHPVGDGRVVWHLGHQDAIAIGRLFAEGVLDFTRVLALGGECSRRPRLLRTRLGAALDDLVRHEAEAHVPCRVWSGSPLSGRVGLADRSFVGRFDQQVSLMRRADAPRAFGWWWRGRTSRPARDNRGQLSGMLPLERFERLMQPGFLAVPLLRALMAGDVDRAHALGCLELDEDDLALCAWACPARSNYPGALRDALERIRREG